MVFPPISDGLFFAEPVGTYEKGTFSIGKGNHSEAVGFFLKKDFFFRNNFTNKFNNVKKHWISTNKQGTLTKCDVLCNNYMFMDYFLAYN